MLATEPRLSDVALDWNEPARVVRVEVDQDRARQLGLSSQDISNALAALFSGRTVTQLRDGIFLIDVVSFDWNCPKYITPRFTADEVAEAVAPLRARIAELEALLKSKT